MRLLRTIAIFSNLAFIVYGTIEWLPPVLFLHLVLLPLNIVHLPRLSGRPDPRAKPTALVPNLWAPRLRPNDARLSDRLARGVIAIAASRWRVLSWERPLNPVALAVS